MSAAFNLARLFPTPTELTILATRAMDAAVNERPTAESARHEFIDQLCQQTGLSEGMLFLLRKEGLLP